ncbi:cell division protein SepF [Planococcus sp. N028]|uniref:Cell division protein SepF n=1 Tax=Planococcus shixiaomingii TaxID=3058393 RepID=A0ABT8N0B7_9BACL|nr:MULTISPECIES: cell division protein SepF [unclassified Planococcus (in: firmicutes)]MDN7241331.1 cell division protein SepF [Planococcus sp. N028]WKA53585.1 cell division protein SepF [Planococcus sp. N022]
MSIKNKFKNFFYLEEYEDEQPQQAQQPQPQAPRYEKPATTVQKTRDTPKERRQKAVEAPTVPNLVSLQSAMKASKVNLVEPRVYAEAQDIAEHLKSKRAVVVNLQRIEKDQGLRIIDFLSGTVYALGGDIQRIGTDIFLCVPDTVEVDGAISDFYYDDQQ